MVVIESKLRKWGNSFAIIVPMDVVEKRRLRENMKVRLLLFEEGRKVLRETFGIGKDKVTKTGQQFKDESRRELY